MLVEYKGLKYSIQDKIAILVGYTKDVPAEVIVPDTVEVDKKQYLVSRIQKEAFKDCVKIEVLRIGNNIKWIEERAFLGCNNLEKVRMNTGVHTIADYCFCSCEKLKYLTMPSKLTFLGEGAFMGCLSLDSVDIPSSLISIPRYAFLGTILKEVEIPTGVQSIEDYAFKSIETLKNIRIPSTINNIGIYAFVGCSNLSHISVSDSNNIFEAHDGILYSKGCEHLYKCPENKSSSVSVKSKVRKISKHAFENCMKLTSVKLPKNLLTIGKEAFAWNEPFRYIEPKSDEEKNYGLRSLVIPNQVMNIADEAFIDHTVLEKIFVPKSVRYMGNKVFQGCSNLTIYFEGNKIPNTWDKAFNPDNLEIIFNASKKKFE